MPEPHTHRFQVEIGVAGVHGPAELVMPAWAPGSYLIREFARNVGHFQAEDGTGTPLAWRKTSKHTWRIDAPADGTLRVRYTAYANELSVRASHLDASHGYVNGTSVFMYVAGREHEPLAVRVDAPAGWRVTTALPTTGAPDVFAASGYDELADSPFEIGTHDLLEWDVDGVPHRYAVWGRGNLDAPRLLADTDRIVRAARELFGALPYRGFTFFLHLTPGGRGGLEHRDSTSLQVDRWSFRGRPYEETLALVAHEHFHAWNGKRIRPATLGPFDYTRENHTSRLWVVEGLTTYYTEMILRRAGIVSPKRCLKRIGEMIERFRALPGARAQTLEAASWDTWIRFYRPDADTPNSQISYYQKGALVGLLLDLRIRAATGHARSLDDVMRLLWERYGSRDVGFPEEGGIREVAEEACGEDLGEFFERSLRSTGPLDLESALDTAGVRIGTGGGTDGEARATPETPAHPEPLGMRLRDENGHTRVTHVLAGTPAYEAGVNAGDELLALDGFRVSAATLPARVAESEPGKPLALALFRRDELKEVQVAAAPPRPWLRLERLEDPTPLQTAIFADWLRTDVAEHPNESLDGREGNG